MKDHPAKFADSVIGVIARILVAETINLEHVPTVVDPFAGIGKIEEAWPKTVGLELEWEWAEQGGVMIQGNALTLPFAPRSIQIFATSPCYGNRMADRHNAQERCKPCRGTGLVSASLAHPHDPPTYKHCDKCGGAGRRVYDRLTYRHKLGRMPSEGSSAVMQWGPEYRIFHKRVWRRLHDALVDDGLFVLNIGDHIRLHKRQHVTAWHRRTILTLGFEEERRIKVKTPKMKKGQNYETRVPYETVFAFRKVA